MENEFEERCYDFPRFYFINRSQLIETLSFIRDSRKYLNTVRLCFPGIHNLEYRLPKSALSTISAQNSKINETTESDPKALDKSTSFNTKFNFDIYGKKSFFEVKFITCNNFLFLANELEVSSIIGSNGLEKFDLVLPLNSYDLQKTSEWFDNLLKLMKSTLCFITQEYLSGLGEKANDYSQLQIITKRNFDLTSIPFQCIMLTEALIWSNNIKRMLNTNKNEEIKYVYNYLNKSISECSNLQTSKCEKRVKELLSRLVLYYLYQREVTLSLMKLSELNAHSYEWQAALKYEYDASTLFARQKESGMFIIIKIY